MARSSSDDSQPVDSPQEQDIYHKTRVEKGSTERLREQLNTQAQVSGDWRPA